MKKIIIYTLSVFSLMVLGTSCADNLDTEPTTAVSGALLMKDTKTAMYSLNGIYRSYYRGGWSVEGNAHQASTLSNYNIMADAMGEDFVMKDPGSGWFWYDCTYDVKRRYTTDIWRSYDIWNFFYKQIADANLIIASAETMQGTQANKNQVIGAAYAIRAFGYYYLASVYARTYVGHETDPGVPLYTEPTTKNTKGQPRSSLENVYTLIYTDINKAVELLETATAREVQKSKAEKSYIDYAVANGLKARIALSMNKWGDAKAAAAIAREKFSIGGSDQLSKGMNDVMASNVIWGAFVKADQSGMYASYMSHVASDGPYGKSAPKVINKDLYAKMNTKDIRRAWWIPTAAAPYQQEKFKFSNRATWEGDEIWMRAEEMILIQAEAECMLGNDAAAQNLLKELMKTRDADYMVTKTGTDLGNLTTDEKGTLREEILIQRRIELWGEGFRIFDIKRLKQGFTRTAAMGWPNAALIQGKDTQSPESYAWVLTIPQAEFDGNSALDQIKDQNPLGDK